MQRYKLTFEYDGSQFSGWQIQPDARTVEGVAEEAFATLYQQQIDLIGQGRTDAGVHAQGQVAHADVPENFSESRIIHAMQGLLPEDVVLNSIEAVHPGFHARFDAVSRRYRYTVTKQYSPLKRHISWYYPKQLDVHILKKLAECIIGEHDFVNFCIPPDDEYSTTDCTIIESFWTEKENSLIFEIQGNRFMRHLVRRLVGSMIMAAGGGISVQQFAGMLDSSEVKEKGFSAPAKGLILEKVSY